MTFWPALWKWVFLFGVSAFTLLSIWVTVAGAGDVRRLFEALDPASRRKKRR